jgi:thiamine biosynthesis lipoprotein
MTAVASPQPFAESFPALGTTATVLVTERAAVDVASVMLRAEADAVDRACSRFRDDSEIRRVERAGVPVEVSELLADHLSAALRAGAVTDGLVDPTVEVAELGYDRDFAAIVSSDELVGPGRPAPGWWRIAWDAAARRVALPDGVRVDLGSTAKALTADRAADWIHSVVACGVLVNLGGDIAVAGDAPDGGWRITVTDDHTTTGPVDQLVRIGDGGLASSGTTRRRWHRGGRELHHIVDPRTGLPAAGPWRTATAAARSCLDANIASTAAIVLGHDAIGWLTERAIPARLVGTDGRIRLVGPWPGNDRPRAGDA